MIQFCKQTVDVTNMVTNESVNIVIIYQVNQCKSFFIRTDFFFRPLYCKRSEISDLIYKMFGRKAQIFFDIFDKLLLVASAIDLLI